MFFFVREVKYILEKKKYFIILLCYQKNLYLKFIIYINFFKKKHVLILNLENE